MNLHYIFRNQTRSIFYNFKQDISKTPTSSEVLSAYLKHCKEPPWTSYFVKVGFSRYTFLGLLKLHCLFQYSSIYDDHWGKSHFNYQVGNSNYHILRTGCFPYIKYHCTKRNIQDLSVDDTFFRVIKVLNLGTYIQLKFLKLQ